MKKILFVLPSMNAGGIEKALVSLLKEIDCGKYDITLLLLKKGGAFLPFIPECVNITEADGLTAEERDLIISPGKTIIKSYVKKGKIFKAAGLVIKKVLGISSHSVYLKLSDKIRPLDKSFDVAIAYQSHAPQVFCYVAEKVAAKKKIAWFHNDFYTTGFGKNMKKDKRTLKAALKFDAFITVSKKLKEEFISFFPEFSEKTEIIYNSISAAELYEKANEPADWSDDYTGKRILSVGRLTRQKGFDLAIEVAQKLKDDGQNFRWYIIGAGTERENLDRQIKKYGLEKDIVLMGQKTNPYPYFKSCDIYVQPSRHEGYCTTTNEAKIFFKPIVTTLVSGADEQFKDGANGRIIGINVDEIFKAVKGLLTDAALCEKFSKALRTEDISTGAEAFDGLAADN